jgi:hypothetical protein
MQRVLIALLGTGLCFGALSSSTVMDVRPTVGSDTANGGTFDASVSSPGTDYSQQNTSHVTFNGTSITATTTGASATITLTGYTVAATDEGNGLNITGGISFNVGSYTIESVNVGLNTWTLDRVATSGAGSAMTGGMGGAFATVAQANSIAVASNVVWVKATGAYTVTTFLPITLVSTNAPATPYSIIGYTSTRGDGGQFTWTTSTNSADLIHMEGVTNVLIENAIMTSTALTPGYGIMTPGSPNTPSTNVQCVNCFLSGFNIGVFGDWTSNQTFQGFYLIGSRITACVNQGLWSSGNTYIFGSMIDNNGADGARWENSNAGALAIWWVASWSVFYHNGANGFFMVQSGASTTILDHDDFSTNTTNGVEQFNNASEPFMQVSNSIFDANGAFGINTNGIPTTPNMLIGPNACYNNTSGCTQGISGVTPITLTASPYVSLGTNFALNNTSGGGAALKTAGAPSTIPGAGSGAPAIGALQPSSSGAGQKGFPVVQ